MLLTHSINLPLVSKTESRLNRQMTDSSNSNVEYKLHHMMDIPNGFHKEVRDGDFDILCKKGLFKNKLTLVPRLVESPDSYLMLQVYNSSVYTLDMHNPKVTTADNIKYIVHEKQPLSSGDNFTKNKALGTNFLFRLENFDETSPPQIIWLNYSTDLLGQQNKTSVILELEPYWFTSQAFSSEGTRCCQFNSKSYFLDPSSSFAKSCTNVDIALEIAKLNTYPITKDDALALSTKKQKGKYV